LDGANLTGAHLEGAQLEGANLVLAHLERANLEGAQLEDAQLERAYLERAYLYESNLDRANFLGANLAGIIFEPQSLENVHLDDAENLSLMTFTHSPTALVRVRSQFKDSGLREQENQITFAIRRSEMQRHGPKGVMRHGGLERAFNYIFFEFPCQYGASPGRPLLLVAVLAVLLSVVYIFAQVNPGPSGGIWAVWDEHRIRQDEGSSKPERLTDGFPCSRSQTSFYWLALYFSLLSATRIGWHELNVGTWLTRIQPRQYSLQATGWVRVVSGVQSLVSVYLVALSVLSYFGAPFE
jgi:hypothetical protein